MASNNFNRCLNDFWNSYLLLLKSIKKTRILKEFGSFYFLSRYARPFERFHF